jgi:putative oxidoreductase
MSIGPFLTLISSLRDRHVALIFPNDANPSESSALFRHLLLLNVREVPMFPQLIRFADLGLLLLRLMAGIVFFVSGWGHLNDPAGRAQSIGQSKGFTIFLGIAEVAGSLGIIFGVFQQLAAIGLILIMLGAIQKKIFVWHTGFWGEKASGWHYDLMFAVMCLVILFTDGGRYVLLK